MQIYVSFAGAKRPIQLSLERYSAQRLETKLKDAPEFKNKKIISITDLEGRNISELKDSEIAKKNEFRVVVKCAEEENAPTITFREDFVPDPKMLVDGGVTEYDFVTALAEIIDNSIEAMTETNSGERMLEIQYNENQIIIKDNGKGMFRDEIIKWGTLGLNSKQRGVSMISCPYPQYICGQFSRFGVGSKNAAFFLGDDVTVTSKNAESKSIHTVSFHRSDLEKRRLGDKSDWWKDDVKTTFAPDDQVEHHFTITTINNLKQQFLAISSDAMDQHRARIEEIFHYYIFGPNSSIPTPLEKLNFGRSDLRLSERALQFLEKLKEFAQENPPNTDHFFLLPANGMEVYETLSKSERKKFIKQHIVLLAKQKKMTKASLTAAVKEGTLNTMLKPASVTSGDLIELGKRLYVKSNNIDLFASFGDACKQDGTDAYYLPISEPLYCPPFNPILMDLMKIKVNSAPSPWDREFRFEVFVEAAAQKNTQVDAEAMTDNKIRCTFRFQVLYFPCVESEQAGKRVETNPDFADDRGALMNPTTTYWFWNGRLITRASLDFWLIFKAAPTRGIPRECYTTRTRIFAFVDSSIGVAKNKVYLDMDSPLLKELETARSKGAARRYTEDLNRFVEQCYIHYDLEAEWKGAGTHQGDRTYYTEATVQGNSIKRGVHVKTTGSKKFGWIEALYEDSKKQKMARIIPWAEDRDSNSKISEEEIIETPLSKLSFLNPEQWAAEIAKAKEQFGKELIFDKVAKGSKVDDAVCLICLQDIAEKELKCKSCKSQFHKDCYTNPVQETEAYLESIADIKKPKLWCCDECVEKPDDQEYHFIAQCGQHFKEAVTLYDDNGKPKATQHEIIWVIFDPSGQECKRFENVKQYKNNATHRGKYYVQNFMFPKPGIYTMKAQLKGFPSIQGVSSVKVVPGSPAKFQEVKLTNDSCLVGEEIPQVNMVCVDKKDNPIRLLQNHPPPQYSLSVLNSDIVVTPGHSLSVNSDGELVLSGVALEGSIDNEAQAILACSLVEDNSDMTCLIRLTLQPGPPSVMEAKFPNDIELENYNYLPKFLVHIYDSYGNHIRNDENNLFVQLTLANEVEFPVSDGIAEIDLESKEMPIECSFGSTAEEDKEPVEQVTFQVKLVRPNPKRRMTFTAVKDIEPIECTFTVRPSKKPHRLNVFLENGEQLTGPIIMGHGFKLTGQAEEMVQLHAQFVNEGQTVIDLKNLPPVTFSFSKHFEVPQCTMDQLRKKYSAPADLKKQQKFLLPPLSFPSSILDKSKGEIQVICGRKWTYPLEFKVTAAPPNNFDVKTSNNVQCSKPFTVAITLKDRFKNTIHAADLSSEYKDVLVKSISVRYGEGLQFELQPVVNFQPDIIVLSNLQIEAVGKYQMEIKFGDSMNQVIPLIISHGPPASLQVNEDMALTGRSEGQCKCKVAVVDDQGNICDTLPEAELEATSSCFLQKKTKVKLLKGVAYVTAALKKMKYGSYKVDFEATLDRNEKISTQVELEISKSNAVKKITLLDSLDPIEAGEPWQFKVKALTEDEEPLSTTELFFKVVVSSPALVGSDIEIVPNIVRETDNVFLFEMDKLDRAGKYTAIVRWDEQRPELEGTPSAELTLPIFVKARYTAALKLVCHCAAPSLHGEAIFFRPVSNKSDFKERLLCKNLELIPVDMYDNATDGLLHDIQAILTPVNQSESDSLAKPEVIHQDLVAKKGSYFVHNLSIKADSGSGTAEYQIHFEGKTATEDTIKSITRQFKFSDDAGKTRNERLLSEVMQQLHKVTAERLEIEKRIHGCREELTQLESTIAATMNVFGISLDQYNDAWAAEMRQKLNQDKRDLSRELGITEPMHPHSDDQYVQKVRQLVAEHGPKTPRDHPLIYGLGLDIICLPANEHIAKGVQLAIAPNDMKLIVLRTKEAEAIIDRNFTQKRSITVDLAENYRRGAPSITDNRIPDEQILPRCCLNGSVDPKKFGFLGFLVNLIELRPFHLFLRTSVFWSVFRTKMIFENYAQARDFRAQVLQNRESCPPIQCLDGTHIEGSGVRANTNQNRAWKLGEIPIEYSQAPPALALGRKFRALKELPAHVEKFRQLMDNYHAVQATLTVFNNNNAPLINDLQKRKDEIEAKISSGSRKRTRDEGTSNNTDNNNNDGNDRPRKKRTRTNLSTRLINWSPIF